MFMNDPDYVPSVFVYSTNAGSNKDKRSRYERLRKCTRNKGAKGCQSFKHQRNEVPQPSPSPQPSSDDTESPQPSSDGSEQLTNNELHTIDQAEDSEDDMPAEENASTEENVATKEDRRVVAKVDKNFSTDSDANDWCAIEKKIAEQQELLQNELRATRPSTKLQGDDKSVHFILDFHRIQYMLHCSIFWWVLCPNIRVMD